MAETKKEKIKRLAKKPEATAGFGDILVGVGKAVLRIGQAMIDKGEEAIGKKTIDAPR